MKSHDLKLTVYLPTVDDFAAKYPHYGPRARNDGQPLFELVMTPSVFLACSVLTDTLGLPAVTAVAQKAVDLMGGSLEGTDKQFLGALTCALMEANGYKKTGQKRSIPHGAWNRGEVYRRP